MHRWFLAFVSLCGLALFAPAQAQDTQIATWKTAAEAQCVLVEAARSKSSAKLLTTFEEILKGRTTKEELARATKPLVGLIQNRRPASANAFELASLEGELNDALIIITFSDGVKLFAHLTLAKSRDGWSFLGIYYNVNWERVRPRIALPSSALSPVACGG